MLEEHLLENDILEDKEEDKILIWTYANSCEDGMRLDWDPVHLRGLVWRVFRLLSSTVKMKDLTLNASSDSGRGIMVIVNLHDRDYSDL